MFPFKMCDLNGNFLGLTIKEMTKSRFSNVICSMFHNKIAKKCRKTVFDKNFSRKASLSYDRFISGSFSLL